MSIAAPLLLPLIGGHKVAILLLKVDAASLLLVLGFDGIVNGCD